MRLLITLVIFTLTASQSAFSQTPTHPLHGTTIKLHNGETAQRVNSILFDAQQAIRKCDKQSLYFYTQRLSRLSMEVYDYGDTTSDITESVLSGMYQDPDHADARNIEDLIDQLESSLQARMPCGEAKKKIEDSKFAFQLMAGTLRALGITGFFGTENAGGGNRQLGVLKADDKGTFTGQKAELRVPFKRATDIFGLTDGSEESNFWDVFIGAQNANANLSGGVDQFNSGSQTLLIPGAANPGFSILGPNGVANQLTYDADYNFAAYQLGFGKTFFIPNLLDTILRPFGGIEYGHLNMNETFGGNLPIVVRTFQYNTNVDNNYFAPFIGLEGSTRPQAISNFFQIPIELSGSVRYAFTLNDAKGDDNLSFTGFPTDSVNISEDDNTHDIQANLGFTFNPDGVFSVTIGAGFQRTGNIPQVTRTGTGPSNLSFEQANIWSGSVRGTLKF